MDFATSSLNLGLAAITSFLILGLGIVVFLKNKHAWINRSFGVFSLGATIWISSAYLSDLPWLLTFSLYLNRMIFAGLSLMIAGLCHFCFVFPTENKHLRFFQNIVYSIGIVLIFLSLFTPLVIKGITSTDWGTDLITGPFYPLFISFSFTCILGVVKIFREYKKVTGVQKSQLQYLFLGLFLFTLINIFIHMIVPTIRGTREFYQIGNYSILFLIGATAYAIAAHRLFDIRIILSEIFVVLIGLILFVQILTSETIWAKVLNAGVFVSFCIFGYFLIRATIREIKMRKEVQKMANDLEKTYRELKKLDEAKTEFISIASHQLRTPLTIVKGYISMLMEGSYGELPDKANKPLKNVFDSNERLIRLVNDLLTVSKVETGRIEVEFGMASIEEIISSLVDEFELRAKEKGIYIRWEKPKTPLPKLIIDKEKIGQAILNILDNATHYTGKGGITVKTKALKSKIQIIISDTGEGMTRKEAEKLFTSFSRGSAGVRLWAEGAGLGLYIARRFVDFHKGKIWAESPGKGRGSTFYIELPMKLK